MLHQHVTKLSSLLQLDLQLKIPVWIQILEYSKFVRTYDACIQPGRPQAGYWSHHKAWVEVDREDLSIQGAAFFWASDMGLKALSGRDWPLS